MAIVTVSVAGGNWNAGGSWVGGVVPATTDSVAFTATSGNLTINVASTCAGINFTNYVGTFTVNTYFRINGNINLGTGGYTVAGGNTMYIGATGTITSNGTAWRGNFGFLGTSQTYTLADDLTINGTITCNVTTLGTLNGFTIYAKSSYSHTGGNLGGTTNVVFNGTGNWNHTTGIYIGLNTTINTSGTITFGPNGVSFGGGATLTYVSGTVVATTPFYVMGSCSLDVAPIAFNSFQINGTSTVCTLLDNITVNGELRFNGATACTVNGFNIYCNSNVYIQPNYTVGGTSVIQLVGTGSWTHQTASYMSLPIVINTSGTITFGGNGLRLAGGTSLIYTAGTLAGSNFLYFGSSRILDLNTSVWLSVTNNAAATLTLLSDLNLSGELKNGSGTLTINGTYTVYIGGNLTRSSNTVFSGTASLVMNGTGTWSDLYQAQILGFDLTINTTGTITISGAVSFSNRTFTHIIGTVITTGSTLSSQAATTWDCSGITWDTVNLQSSTHTLNSTFNVGGTLALASVGAVTFAGTSGYVAANLTCGYVAARTVTLKSSLTYTVNSSLALSNMTLQSSVSSSYAFFNVDPAATMSNTGVTTIDIDSSGGQTVISPLSTFTRTINWSLTPNTGNFLLMF